MKNQKKNKKIRMIFSLLITILIVVSGFFAYMILQGRKTYREGNNTYEGIKEIAIKTNDIEDTDRIDFSVLKNINEDVIGWLSLENTVIDYPVVKGQDNDYYLNHLYTGEYNSLGTLFVDFRNRELFTDQISVIYGHSMLNGSMFFILERYKNQSFYEEHKQFVFDTPDHRYILEPYAGKVVDAKIPFLQFNFTGKEEYFEYISEFISTSTFKADFEPSENDKTVMMIKCSADYEDARYVLLCRVREA
jgi:sortase B